MKNGISFVIGIAIIVIVGAQSYAAAPMEERTSTYKANSQHMKHICKKISKASKRKGGASHCFNFFYNEEKNETEIILKVAYKNRKNNNRNYDTHLTQKLQI